MSLVHPDIRAVAELLASEPTGRFRLDGSEKLSDRLYRWYLNCTPIETVSGCLQPWELNLEASLHAAHADALKFEGGWRAKTVSTWGRTVVERDGNARVVNRSDYIVPAGCGLRAEPGDAILASGAWTFVDQETGFWHARRGRWPPEDADRLIRLYWNSDPAHVPRLFHELTSVFAANPDVSYMAKTPVSPDHNGRSDVFVLYIGPAAFYTLGDALIAIANELERGLRSASPRFTLRLAHGLAMADGDLNGDSFGEVRCRLVADAFDSASEAVRISASRLSRHIATRFESAGLDPDLPHLLGKGLLSNV